MMNLLAHRVTGNPDGPPLFLLNGGLMTMAAWEKIAAPLEDAFRIVRCDFRGQLFSPGVPEPRLEPHAEDLVALLDALEIERIHAAGTSFGALVALRLAALHPERVASVIAITATEKVTPELWAASARVRDACLEAVAGGDGGRVYDLVIPATYSPEYLEANAATLALYRRQVGLLPAAWYAGLAPIIGVLEGLDLTPYLPLIQAPTRHKQPAIQFVNQLFKRIVIRRVLALVFPRHPSQSSKRSAMNRAGGRVHRTRGARLPRGEDAASFLRSGGWAFCLALRLDRRSMPVSASRDR